MFLKKKNQNLQKTCALFIKQPIWKKQKKDLSLLKTNGKKNIRMYAAVGKITGSSLLITLIILWK